MEDSQAGAGVGARARSLLVLCLSLHAVLALGILAWRPEALSSWALQLNPDAMHYVFLADNLIDGNGFSRMTEPPFQPDALRTPVFPVLMALAKATGAGVWLLYAVNALCVVITVLLVYKLARGTLVQRFAYAIAAWFAFDLLVAISSFEAMSEPLYVVLSVAGIAIGWQALTRPGTQRHELARAGAAGLVCALAALTRPTGLYLPFVLVAGAVVSSMTMRTFGRALMINATILVTVFLVGISPWVMRNGRTFGVYRLSTVDRMSLVYFVGAGPYQLELGIGLEPAQDVIARQFNLRSNVEHHNPWSQSKSIKELDDELREAAPRVLRQYPPWRLLQATAIGVTKSAFAHSAGSYAELTGRTWTPPGLGAALRLRFGDFFASLVRNPLDLIAIFVVQLISSALLCGLAVCGAIAVVGQRRRLYGWAIPLTVVAYYLMTIGMGGLDSTSRFRYPILFVAYWLAGHGLFAVSRFRSWTPIANIARPRRSVAAHQEELRS